MNGDAPPHPMYSFGTERIRKIRCGANVTLELSPLAELGIPRCTSKHKCWFFVSLWQTACVVSKQLLLEGTCSESRISAWRNTRLGDRHVLPNTARFRKRALLHQLSVTVTFSSTSLWGVAMVKSIALSVFKTRDHRFNKAIVILFVLSYSTKPQSYCCVTLGRVFQMPCNTNAFRHCWKKPTSFQG